MKFMITWSYPADRWGSIVERWNSGDTERSENEKCKCLGRWHGVVENKGFALYETTDPIAFNEAMFPWRDLLDYEVTVVISDETVPEGYQIK